MSSVNEFNSSQVQGPAAVTVPKLAPAEPPDQIMDEPGIIERVLTLYRGNLNMILGFNTLLQPGYRIECSLDPLDPDSIRLTTPMGSTKRSNANPSTPDEGQQVRAATSRQAQRQQLRLLHFNGGPVEFSHAINYVNKIKSRFASQPEVFKKFLEILQAYQREQLRIAGVYSQVAVLFKDATDLVDGFKPFVPDPTQPDWRTRLIHPNVNVPGGFTSLVAPVHRGSTVVFKCLADARDEWSLETYTYGLYGTPTTRELALRIAQLEGAYGSLVVPGGQAAILLVYLTLCSAGTHVLVPDAAYRPNIELAEDLLSRFGIEVETYDPLAGSEIKRHFKPNTTLVWCESPCSVTMEIQDVGAIVSTAHASGIKVAIDNTYSAGVLFDAFKHGVDISVQALTKYVGGHSDILLGSVSAPDDETLKTLAATHRLLGLAVSPDDCSLALRGLETLAVRLDHLERTTLKIAKWLAERAEVELVLHPAFPSCPGHETWARDFTGSTSVFSIVFTSDWDQVRITHFVESLKLFRIGFSWGGTTSLVMAYPPLERASSRHYNGRLIRLNVGLEDCSHLIEDLAVAFSVAQEAGKR